MSLKINMLGQRDGWIARQRMKREECHVLCGLWMGVDGHLLVLPTSTVKIFHRKIYSSK